MKFIALDVEAAGPKLGVHATLSIGACLVVNEDLPIQEYRDRGISFYAELKPTSSKFDYSAMKTGCLHLDCLDDMRDIDKRFDPTHPNFAPSFVLKKMQNECENPEHAISRFLEWIGKVCGRDAVMGVTDTVFFDGGRIDHCLSQFSSVPSPFGWKGIDLTSMYRGYTREYRSLEMMGVPDKRLKPHRADEDAIYLAQMAKVLLFDKLKW